MAVQLSLTWARGATGLEQLDGYVPGTYAADGVGARGTFPLTDIVLPPLGFVSLTAYRGATDGGAGECNIQNIAVTYTLGAGPVSTGTLVDLTPFLLPVSNG